MKGARKFAKLFDTDQYGKLYIVSGDHARGRTFRIQVLPKGVIAKKNGAGNLCLNTDAVEVYGVVSGNPGWTEEYGWLHEGKWQDDFQQLVEEKEHEVGLKEAKNNASKEERRLYEGRRKRELLSNY